MGRYEPQKRVFSESQGESVGPHSGLFRTHVNERATGEMLARSSRVVVRADCCVTRARCRELTESSRICEAGSPRIARDTLAGVLEGHPGTQRQACDIVDSSSPSQWTGREACPTASEKVLTPLLDLCRRSRASKEVLECP